MNTPTAEIIQHRGRYIVITCPYCGAGHEHAANIDRFAPGTTHHRAPGCGLYRSPADRAAGYTFTIPPKGS